MAVTRPTKRRPSNGLDAETVDVLLATLKHPGRPVIQAVRKVILAADPRIKEGIKWKAPSFYTAEHFATFHLRAKTGVSLVLHLGARARPDVDLRSVIGTFGMALEWKGSDRATLTFRDVAQVRRETTAFRRLIRAWIRHVR